MNNGCLIVGASRAETAPAGDECLASTDLAPAVRTHPSVHTHHPTAHTHHPSARTHHQSTSIHPSARTPSFAPLDEVTAWLSANTSQTTWLPLLLSSTPSLYSASSCLS